MQTRHFTIRLVRALPGGEVTEHDLTRFEDLEDAIDEADRLQTDFDDDGEAVRVLVVDRYDVPIAAGCEDPTRRIAVNSAGGPRREARPANRLARARWRVLGHGAARGGSREHRFVGARVAVRAGACVVCGHAARDAARLEFI